MTRARRLPPLGADVVDSVPLLLTPVAGPASADAEVGHQHGNSSGVTSSLLCETGAPILLPDAASSSDSAPPQVPRSGTDPARSVGLA